MLGSTSPVEKLSELHDASRTKGEKKVTMEGSLDLLLRYWKGRWRWRCSRSSWRDNNNNVIPAGILACVRSARIEPIYIKSDDEVVILDGTEFPHPISLQSVYRYLSSLVLGATCTFPDGRLVNLNILITIATHIHLTTAIYAAYCRNLAHVRPLYCLTGILQAQWVAHTESIWQERLY